MGDDFMVVLKLHAECCVRQQFGYDAREFKDFFFCHVRVFFLLIVPDRVLSGKIARKLHNPGTFVNL
ncbi:hypothetical protein AGR2A_Cc30322 [Agrobacterium genomosp. 2 str. CFBP 5494]|jgi:hypothetical protein|uniref:Uncharacterized protein n=1 Tax=Agrobacterium genomosp. 2 str. CFBP 5494 TaxID=1183436 RepID=A0A9W5B1G2_9HYPH|nr:hypothetical protein AGR2A_Cc30322 [Agrobacterium genomosp. 2 str. CFBP 5494]